MPDVNISYKGSQIASMESSGVKTLLTSGKYCENDIFVSYNKIGNATAEGNSSVSVNDAESGNICSLIQYGVCEQDAQTNAISCNNGTLSVSSGEIVTTAANREAIALGSQTATVENLYSVGNIRDEQELVTGMVTRKNAACIYDGTQPVGDRYISSTGAKDNGAIIIYPLETEHIDDSIVSFTETVKQDVNSLEVSIEPIQDLHGYANPWPAGGGKNLLPLIDGTYAVGSTGATAVIDNGKITVNGTTTSSGGRTVKLSEYFTLSAGDYIISPAQNTSPYIRIYLNKKSDNTSLGYSTGAEITLTEETEVYCGIAVESGKTYSNVEFYPQVESGTTATAYAPYSNICPISGRTGLNVYRTGKNLFDKSTGIQLTNKNVLVARYVGYGVPFKFKKGVTYTISCNSATKPHAIYILEPYTPTATNQITNSYSITIAPTEDTEAGINEPYNGNTYNVDWSAQAGTVYGGTLDVVTGVLTVDRVNIPSYNGETINEPWLSSMDAYAEGTTPTIGAQVVYTLATPLTYQLSAQEVQMLLGENNVWSSSGDTVSVTYYAEGNANPLQSLNILLGGNYSNPKTADDVSDKEALEIILGGNK